MKSDELEEALNTIKNICKMNNTHKYDEVIKSFSDLIGTLRENEEKLEVIKANRCKKS